MTYMGSKYNDHWFSELEKRIKKLEKKVFENESTGNLPKQSIIEQTLVKQVDTIPVQHIVVISLRLRRKQTREEIKKTLEDWGKVFGNWFKGGNFNNRLIKKIL